MTLWIDTAATARAQTLFGVPPIERLRRSAGKLVAGTPVILSGPDAKQHTWPVCQQVMQHLEALRAAELEEQEVPLPPNMSAGGEGERG